jgi:N utilization substance protein B
MAQVKALKGARRRSREIALQALYAWQLGSGDALEQVRQIDDDGRTDRALAEALVRGVQARAADLEGLIAPCLDREFRRLSPVERAILYIGAFELQAHPETPFRVVINEAIELGKSFGGTGGHKYVNGVLEKLARGLRAQEVAGGRQPA